MLRFVRRRKVGYTLYEIANNILQLQRMIAYYLNILQWNDVDGKRTDLRDLDENRSVLIKFFKNSIKKNDNLDVDDKYINDFGNSCFFHSSSSLKVNFNFNNKVSDYYQDVFYISNIDIDSSVAINLFKRLIDVFHPLHGTLTSEDLIFDYLNCNGGDLWIGTLTYISNELHTCTNGEFEEIPMEEGKIIRLNSSLSEIETDPLLLSRLKKLYQLVNSKT